MADSKQRVYLMGSEDDTALIIQVDAACQVPTLSTFGANETEPRRATEFVAEAVSGPAGTSTLWSHPHAPMRTPEDGQMRIALTPQTTFDPIALSRITKGAARRRVLTIPPTSNLELSDHRGPVIIREVSGDVTLTRMNYVQLSTQRARGHKLVIDGTVELQALANFSEVAATDVMYAVYIQAAQNEARVNLTNVRSSQLDLNRSSKVTVKGNDLRMLHLHSIPQSTEVTASSIGCFVYDSRSAELPVNSLNLTAETVGFAYLRSGIPLIEPTGQQGLQLRAEVANSARASAGYATCIINNGNTYVAYTNASILSQNIPGVELHPGTPSLTDASRESYVHSARRDTKPTSIAETYDESGQSPVVTVDSNGIEMSLEARNPTDRTVGGHHTKPALDWHDNGPQLGKQTEDGGFYL